MDAIRKYAKRTTMTTEMKDACTRAALSSRGGNCGCGRGGRGGGLAGGQGNGRQKHKCSYCKMGNHSAKACTKRRHAEIDGNISRNIEQKCYHCGLTGHFKADCIHFKGARYQHKKVNKGTASATLAQAGDCDLI